MITSVAENSWQPVPAGRYVICEAFSQPRATKWAREAALPGGWALNISMTDPITEAKWDLRCPRVYRRACARLREDQPVVLVVPPPCTAFSVVNWNANGGPTKEEWEAAVLLVQRAIGLCRLQERLGGTWVF